MNAEKKISHDICAVQRSMRTQMDHYVTGQDQAKQTLLLALVAQEHAYLEGDPGTAKTLLAEILSHSLSLRGHFCQMHRDTSVADLVGDTVLQRTPLGTSGGEWIRQSLRPGKLLQAELAVLDDITRAPGEALNVLLRILNEREFQCWSLPLISAVATTNPTESGYHNEALDPAALDRFALHARMENLLREGSWAEAEEVITRHRGMPPEFGFRPHADANAVCDWSVQANAVCLPHAVRAAYVRVLKALVNHHGCTPENSLLTDRTMLVKAPRLIQTHALLKGREEASLADLHVLQYMLRFRVPEEVYEALERIIEEACAKNEEDDPFLDGLPQEEGEDGAEEQESLAGEADTTGAEQESAEGTAEDQELAQQIAESFAKEGESADSAQSRQQSSGSNSGLSEKQAQSLQPVRNIKMLLEQIRGQLERNPAELQNHPGGAPRSYRRMTSLGDFLDSDYAETAIWLEQTHPSLPRVYRRRKKYAGGKVVLIRDVSQSMEGRYARWTSSVVRNLIEVVRRQRMRIGYIEFNHLSRKFEHNGRFFTRDYARINEQASNVTCTGVTNYQYPLRDALDELQRGGTHNKHILFITDGEPTQGDWLVREERRRACMLSVSIHTLFIGATQCPEILDLLSEETRGSRFHAFPDVQGQLWIEKRQTAAAQARELVSFRKPGA